MPALRLLLQLAPLLAREPVPPEAPSTRSVSLGRRRRPPCGRRAAPRVSRAPSAVGPERPERAGTVAAPQIQIIYFDSQWIYQLNIRNNFYFFIPFNFCINSFVVSMGFRFPFIFLMIADPTTAPSAWPLNQTTSSRVLIPKPTTKGVTLFS